jgi:hypothetical protein
MINITANPPASPAVSPASLAIARSFFSRFGCEPVELYLTGIESIASIDHPHEGTDNFIL